MSDTKRLFAKPRYPVHVFGASAGEWPEIGPEWTELSEEQLKAATIGAAQCGVQLKTMEVGSARELLDQLQEHGELPPTAPQPTPEVVRVAPPSGNASTEEWRKYAVTDRGLEVHEGASRSDIQAIVAAADEKKTEEA
jgi:hypothetical protein